MLWNRNRFERLMRQVGIQCLYLRKRFWTTVREPQSNRLRT